MEDAKNKITTKQQFEKLVELMQKYPETGRGKPQFRSSKNQTKGLWEKFAVELNILGPPTRTGHEWSRVWIHYKANLKRKLANNYVATVGDTSQEVSLDPLEESVTELVQIREQIAPGGQAFGTKNTAAENNGNEMQYTFVAAPLTVPEPLESNPESRATSSASQTINNRCRNNSKRASRDTKNSSLNAEECKKT